MTAVKSCSEQEAKPREWFQILAILLAAIPSFSEGLLLAWTSPAIPHIINDKVNYNITLEQASYFTVLPEIGMISSSLVYIKLNDSLGRKWAVLSIAIPQIISLTLLATSNSLYVLYAARYIGGLGNSGVFMALPAYIGEVATPKVRGTWGNIISLVQYFALFCMNAVGSVTDVKTTSWICLTIPVLFLITFIFMPESPYFYLMKGKEEHARKALQRLRLTENVQGELDQLKLDVQRQLSESGTWRDLFVIKSNRRAIYAALFLRISQQFGGIPVFETYTQYIFLMAGGNLSAETSSMIFSIICVICHGIVMSMMNRFGRRKPYMISCFFCGLILMCLTIFFCLNQYLADSLNLAQFNWIPITGTLMFILFFSCGMGLIPTLMLGELFSTSIKGKALCLMSINLAILTSFVTKMFQVLNSYIGLYAPFLVFSVTCLVSTVLSRYFVPETKNKTLEEIQQELKDKK